MSDAYWLLALDTSTDWAGVALTDGESLAELIGLPGASKRPT